MIRAVVIALLGLFCIWAQPSLAQSPNALCTLTPGSNGYGKNCVPFGPAPVTNASITVASGNAFQTVLAANPNRISLVIGNNNASDACWIFFGTGTATKALSLELAAGLIYYRVIGMIPSDAIQATCTSTSDTLYVDYQ